MIRINQFVAKSTGVSRRNADELVETGRVKVNGVKAKIGQSIESGDQVTLDGKRLAQKEVTTIIFNKPVGYVCSRKKQGDDPTIYELLPQEYDHLNPVGRLDKDSSGLMILSNDGDLVYSLSHPSTGKWKRYYIETDSELSDAQIKKLDAGVNLEDGISKLKTSPKENGYIVEMQEGRNRQIRRTVEAIGAKVTKLQRLSIGEIELNNLPEGKWQKIAEASVK